MGVTGRELKLILFLLVLLFAGLCIKSVIRLYPDSRRFDYSSVDSLFSNLKNQSDSADNRFQNQNDTVIVKELVTREKNSGKKTLPANRKIDINRATIIELQMLPGVGPKIAEAILAYRINKGPFRSTEDLMYVKGIGPKKFEKIKNNVTTAEN